MPDSKSKKKWNSENILYVTTKLFPGKDRDILNFLEGKARATTIKTALRYYMLHHPEEYPEHPGNNQASPP